MTPDNVTALPTGMTRSTAAPGCENGCPPQYLHGDQIGSTREITGAATTAVPPAAEVTDRVVYTAFGERVYGAQPPPAVTTRYQYAGAWGYQSDLYEDASGNPPFIHVGHRWYDPASGRFLQRDPIGIAGELNVFAYALLSPVSRVDPLGLAPWWSPEELDKSIDCLVNGKPMGAVGAGIGGATAANYKWRLGIGRILNRATVVCSAFWIGWNTGKAIDNVTGVSGIIGDIIHAVGEVPYLPTRGACFIGDTLVNTEHGLVRIDSVVPGDCLTIDNSDYDAVVLAEVACVWSGFTHEIIELYLEGELIVTTPGHPFLVHGGRWQYASQLQVGHRLTTSDGGFVTIIHVRYVQLDTPIRVYNLHVGGENIFAVGNSSVIVHNKQ